MLWDSIQSNAILWLFKQVVRDTPGIPTFVRKELSARHVEDLPSVKPHGSILLSISFLQMRPDFSLAGIHL